MGLLDRGDNRTFSRNSDPSQSRGYVYICLDDAGNVSGFEPHVGNPAIWALGAPFEPYDEINFFTVSQNPGTGDISLALTGLFGFRTQPTLAV